MGSIRSRRVLRLLPKASRELFTGSVERMLGRPFSQPSLLLEHLMAHLVAARQLLQHHKAGE